MSIFRQSYESDIRPTCNRQRRTHKDRNRDRFTYDAQTGTHPTTHTYPPTDMEIHLFRQIVTNTH